MTTRVNERSTSGRQRWGRWTGIALGTLLVLNGAWLFLAAGGAALFESDTGVAMTEVESVFPAVVEVTNRRGASLGILVAGLGAIVLSAIVGSAGHVAAKRSTVLAVAAVLLVVAAYISLSGNWQVGVVYLFYGGIGLLAWAWTAEARSAR